jgi:5'-nucleotidase
MSAPGRLDRRVPLALLAVAAVVTAVAAPAAAHPTGSGGPDRRGHGARTLDIQLLSFNDFHGNLKPPSGSSGRITTGYTETTVNGKLQATPTTVDAGGVEHLAATLRAVRQGHRNSVTVAAGDLIGASPLLSAAFHDEPTIEAMDLLGLEATSVGNHEFDEGFRELLRMQDGGCLPDGAGANNQDSCPNGSFAGAGFRILAANVRYQETGRTILPPYWIKKFKGARIAFIGMTLKDTPSIVTKAGIEGLQFDDEVQTANALVPVLRKKGVKAIVVLLHQGGTPQRMPFTGASGATYSVDPPYDVTCAKGGSLAANSPVLPIARGLDPQIDLVITGHTHQPYVCDVPDSAGRSRLVTSASSFGRLVTETNLTYDLRRRDIVRSSVRGANLVVERKVPAADLSALVARYQQLVAPIANRRVGTIPADLVRASGPSGESALGDLIADAQLADPSVVTAGRAPVVAFMNPGGIRADLVFAPTAGEGAGVVTYEEAFNVQPFNNFDSSMDMTGAQIYDLLEQQWSGPNEASPKVLQVSSGFTYAWKPAAAPGARVVPGSVQIGATQVLDDASQVFRVTANNFLADGGDNFEAFTRATNKFVGGLDIDAFARFLEAHPGYAAPLDRIRTAPGT